VTVGSVPEGLVMKLDLAEEMPGVWAVPGLDEGVAGALSCSELAVPDGYTV
jgi:hypothetical protein